MSDRFSRTLDAVEIPGGEGWLVNGEQQLIAHFRSDPSVSHGQWVEIRTYTWIRPQPPVPQARRRLSKQIAIETWKNMVNVGWRKCCAPVR
jgi:hypothetical protein